MRGYILSVWNFFDPLYYRCTRLTCLPDREETRNIFRVRLTKYRGKLIQLSDGTEIKKNDTLVKIHLHNIKLLTELKDIKNDFKKGKLIYRYVQKSLPELANYIQNHKHSKKIKGIIGISSLNKGCERLGFELFQISNPLYRNYKWLSFFPIGILSNSNMTFTHKPSYLFMSKDAILQKYGDQ